MFYIYFSIKIVEYEIVNKSNLEIVMEIRVKITTFKKGNKVGKLFVIFY